MKKKLIAMLLAGAMVVTALSGCGGGSSSDSSSTAEESTESTENSGEATEIVNKEATIEVPDEVTKGGELSIGLTSSPMNSGSGEVHRNL